MNTQMQALENDNKQWKSHGVNKIGISTEGLEIVWGTDPRFWKKVTIPKDSETELDYTEGMELLQVCWLEIRGTLDLEKAPLLSTKKTYQLFYIIKFKVDAFGWDYGPVPLHLVALDGKKHRRNDNFGKYRKDKWHKVFGGEFTVGSDMKGSVKFSINGYNTPCWKGGMILHGVLVEAKE